VTRHSKSLSLQAANPWFQPVLQVSRSQTRGSAHRFPRSSWRSDWFACPACWQSPADRCAIRRVCLRSAH